MLFLNVDHLKRCRQTLLSSLLRYHEVEENSIDQEIFRNAIIKGYEISQETAFKLLKKALKNFGHAPKKLESTAVKDILRFAALADLMSLAEVERWFIYRDNRNNTAHDYGEAFARETLVLLPDFLDDLATLIESLEQKCGEKCSQDPLSKSV